MQLRTIASKIAGLSLALVMAAGVLLINAPKVSADNTVDDFVNRCYKVALGRDADTDGFNFWKKEITEGRLVGSSVVHQFIFSAEYESQNTSDKQFVNDLYTMFMGRAADQSGYDFWCKRLSEGDSRESIFAGFANSDEFYKVCNDCGITAGYFTSEYPLDQVNKVNLFVERLYKTCLGRIGDKDGQEFWVKGLLKQDLTGISCAANFVNSREYIEANEYYIDYVKNLYRAMMGREYDKGGLDYWFNLLCNNYSRDYVFCGFANSAEFRGICESYGIVPGSYTPSKFFVDKYGIKNEYNDNNQLIKVICPDDPENGLDAYTETFEYSSNGFLTKKVCKYNDGRSYVTTISNHYPNGDAGHSETVWNDGSREVTDYTIISDNESIEKTVYYNKDGKVDRKVEVATKPYKVEFITRSADDKILSQSIFEFYDEDNNTTKTFWEKDYEDGFETRYYYDTEGNPTSSETKYNDGRKEVSTYKNSWHDSESSFYNSDGSLNYYTVYKNSLLILSKSYTNGVLDSTEKYTYDSKNRLIRMDVYEKDTDTLLSYTTTSYNADESVITDIDYNAAGEIMGSKTKEELGEKHSKISYYLPNGTLDYYEESTYDSEKDMYKVVTHHADGTEETRYE